MKRRLNPWLLLLPVVMMLFGMTATSCGNDDEPKGTVIDYYLYVEEQFMVNGSRDFVGRYNNPATRMREAIRSVYPKPTPTGDDDAVLAACEKEYDAYRALYTGIPSNDHLTCVFNLMRVIMEGDRIKQSQRLRTYVYDINPKDEDDDDD